MKKLLSIVFLLVQFFAFPQDESSRKIQESFDHKRYAQTIALIDKIPDQNLTNNEKWIEAESYRQMHNYEESLVKYEGLDLEELGNDSAYLYFAQVLGYNGDYSRSTNYYELFHNNHPEDMVSKHNVDSYMTLDNLPKNKEVSFQPFELNTSENDLVGFYMDEKLVMASSGLSSSHKVYKWDGQHYLDYYSCQEIDGVLKAVPIDSELKTKLHEGPGFYDESSKTLYFTRNARIHDAKAKDEKVSNLKIYTSTYKNDRWTLATEVPFNDGQYSTGHPTGISGQSTLIYSSNKPGGKGEADLYFIHKLESGWSQPQLIEGGINTSGHEVFPFLFNDSTLYFSSNGHGGFGGLDLFKATMKDFKVTKIENLGEGFNSTHDDFGLIYNDVKGLEGYFSSDRENGHGGSDIYTFRYPGNYITILVEDKSGHTIRNEEGTVITSKYNSDFSTDESGRHDLVLANRDDVQVKMNLDGYQAYDHVFSLTPDVDTLKVKLMPQEHYTKINGVVLDDEGKGSIEGVRVRLDIDTNSYFDTTNKTGEFAFILPSKREYDITVYKRGYFTNQIVTDTLIDNLEIKQRLTPMSTGMLLNIENIYYEYDESYITYEAEPILDSLANIMLLNLTLQVEISSHADSRGDEVYNEELSLQRAKSVIDYLKTREVNSSRLSIRYYGESKLINGCEDGINCDEVSHSLNRRTEFKVVSF